MCARKRGLYGSRNHGSKVDTNGVDWGIWWVGGPLMGARTMAIICNLLYQAHIYSYFARLLNSTLGGGKIFAVWIMVLKGGKGPTTDGNSCLNFNALGKSPVVLSNLWNIPRVHRQNREITTCN